MNNVSTTLLLARTANQCMAEAACQPIPKMLFSEFWHEGELCILFADTNVGKSILAVQLADSISRGEAIPGFLLEARRQPVVYLDFELAAKQFEKRYSEDYTNHYQFDDALVRAEINPNCLLDSDLETQMFKEIEENIVAFAAKVVIVDNLTYLKAQATDTAKEALPLMRKLKELKMKHDLSMLVLAHTPKRNSANPITRNDLAGSKHLANFADSIFALGESQTENGFRYLKQIKARATELIYHAENVVVCKIEKHSNFLALSYVNQGAEVAHLSVANQSNPVELEAAIIDLKTNHPSLSNAEIARRAGTYEMKVFRTLNKYRGKKQSNT